MIGVRFDGPIEELIRQIALSSSIGQNSAADVVRTIASAWLMSQSDPVSAFDEIAAKVNVWRKSYAAGLAAGFESKPRDADRPSKKGRRE